MLCLFEKVLFLWSEYKNFDTRDTLCLSNVEDTSTEVRKAAEEAQNDHYKELSTKYNVIPMATETLGSWGQLGLDFKKEIGFRQTKITGDKSQTSWLFQNISVRIQRGNAISVLGTLPYQRKQHEVFHL